MPVILVAMMTEQVADLAIFDWSCRRTCAENLCAEILAIPTECCSTARRHGFVVCAPMNDIGPVDHARACDSHRWLRQTIDVY